MKSNTKENLYILYENNLIHSGYMSWDDAAKYVLDILGIKCIDSDLVTPYELYSDLDGSSLSNRNTITQNYQIMNESDYLIFVKDQNEF